MIPNFREVTFNYNILLRLSYGLPCLFINLNTLIFDHPYGLDY